MKAILFLLVPLLHSVVSELWNLQALNTCTWLYNGECRSSCRGEEFTIGSYPCAFGILGTCCAETIVCDAYGGECRENGCTSSEVEFNYKSHCSAPGQTCCLDKSVFESATTTTPTTTTTTTTTTTSTTQADIIPRQCSRGPRARITGRILGGSAVNSECQWPWMVSIKESSGTHICGGVLVSENKVLTTVECVRGRDVFVTVGEKDVTVTDESGEINIAVSAKPVFKGDFHDADKRRRLFAKDIAMITLDEPIPPASCAAPVCLPQSSSQANTLKCYVAGWGGNENRDGLLHEAEVRVFDFSICSDAMAERGFKDLPGDKICSSPEVDRTDACPGDNGGMLVCEDEEGSWSLHGIISDNACQQTLPLIFTNVTSHLNWVRENI